MIAYLILLLAALTRLVPHSMHLVGMNFTAVGAGLLFFGARRPRWQVPVAMAIMAATDVYLTTQVYKFPFHLRGYLITWAWYGAVCLIGSALLRKVSVLRVVLAVLASSTGFFLWSNFMVWMGSPVRYPHTAQGLGASYVAGLPFYGNDLASTALFAGALFGLPVLAARIFGASRVAHPHEQPAA